MAHGNETPDLGPAIGGRPYALGSRDADAGGQTLGTGLYSPTAEARISERTEPMKLFLVRINFSGTPKNYARLRLTAM
jgi:hypothetical protein